jgi:hypothetical protein
MESQPLAHLNTREPAPGPSNEEATNGVDAAQLDEDINNTTMQQSDEASGESPGTRFIHKYEVVDPRYSFHDTPTKSFSKRFVRPNSSGDEVAMNLQYQMPAATLRTAQLSRPSCPKPQGYNIRAGPPASSEAHKTPQSEELFAGPG